MPWQQHITARHAKWAARYLKWAGDRQTVDAPPWVPLASAILQSLCPMSPPYGALLAAALAQPEEASAHRLPAELNAKCSFGAQIPAGPLRRMANGLRALGPCAAVQVPATPPCCATMPLWGNPLLQLELPCYHRSGATMAVRPTSAWLQHWFEHGYSQLLGLTGLLTLADLQRVHTAAQLVQRQQPSMYGARASSAIASALWGSTAASHRLSTCSTLSRFMVQYEPANFCQAVASMWEAVPHAWKQLCTVQQGHDCTALGCSRGVQHYVISGLGWMLNQQKVLLADGSLTVRNATALQLKPTAAHRQQRHLQYITAAIGHSPTATAAEQLHTGLMQQFKQLWHLHCSNHHKEPLWRLAVNGVPAAGGHDISLPGPCPCGWQGPDEHLPADRRVAAWRRHCFWECSVAAKPVIAELLGSTAAQAGSFRLRAYLVVATSITVWATCWCLGFSVHACYSCYGFWSQIYVGPTFLSQCRYG